MPPAAFDPKTQGQIYPDPTDVFGLLKAEIEADFRGFRRKFVVVRDISQRKRAEVEWNVRLGTSTGRILRIEPRFRGQEVVSPLEKEAGSSSLYYRSHWETEGDRAVRFRTTSSGHPNNVTNTAQGMSLGVEMPREGTVWAELNGTRVQLPLERLLAGARSGNLGGIDSPAYRFHRAPLPWEFEWTLALDDTGSGPDVYYVRVRQKNDQWAWSSPVFLR